MRFIDLEKLLPHIRELIPALNDARNAVMRELDPEARAALINNSSGRWTALRAALGLLSNGKCWYVECRCSGADDDVDHFRPKLAVAGDSTHPGYYWLAFCWRNMRLSSQRANRPRKDPASKQTGGKASHFPLLPNSTRARQPGDDLSLEAPALLDPTNPTDCRLLTFNLNGEVELAPEHKGKSYAEAKVAASVLHLNLNWSTFVEARSALYTHIERLVDRGARAAPLDFDTAAQDTHTENSVWMDAIRDLGAVLDPNAEYSAAAHAYVESFRHEWWVNDIVLRTFGR
jgi:uncharacterized protein (TIGR02646 family)